MYSNNSFWYIFISSFWTFLRFCTSAFVGFLLLSKDAFLKLSRFLLTTSATHGSLHLALDLVGTHTAAAAASMWAVTKFSYLSFGICLRYLLKSIKIQIYIYIYIYIYIHNVQCFFYFFIF